MIYTMKILLINIFVISILAKDANSENVLYLMENEDICEKNGTNCNIDNNKILENEVSYTTYGAILTREINLFLIGFVMGMTIMYLFVMLWRFLRLCTLVIRVIIGEAELRNARNAPNYEHEAVNSSQTNVQQLHQQLMRYAREMRGRTRPNEER